MLNAAELDQEYVDADSCDSEIFSDMRSNQLLIAGDHYTKKGSKFWERIRDQKDLSSKEKLRLTRNHIRYIKEQIVSLILTHAPNTTILPNNESEVQDQKSAELNKSVSEYLKRKMHIREKIREAADDYVAFGEVFSFHYFDPNAGEVKGYAPLTDETGMPVVDEMGQMLPDEKQPIMTGMLVRDRVLAFNVLRKAGVQDLDDSPYLIIRKMVKRKDAKRLADGEKQETFDKKASDNEETFLVFDGDKGKYVNSQKDEVMLRFHFYRPSVEYPKGYYYIAIRGMILSEGELPFGIWPIKYKGFDKIATSARSYSPIKQMRPYQIEINRCASGTATSQVTLGSDKVFLPAGGKLAQTDLLPGVRVFTQSGGIGSPVTMQGRSGEQYLEWMKQSINELYELMGVTERDYTRDGKFDPYSLLYHSVKNKDKFKKYVEAFEEFVVEEEELRLELAKRYFDEDLIIPMVGKDEAVNISEFKSSEPNCYRIKIMPISEDASTMLGKALMMNHYLQYVGSQLGREDIGKMMRAHPFMNMEESFDDFTIDYDCAKNDILALERGATPQPNMYGNNVYTINRLTHRMKKSDFTRLNPQIQQNFQMYVSQLQELEAEKQKLLRAAQADLIPTSGMLITLNNFRVADPQSGEPITVRLPYDAVVWLIQRMQQQGSSLQELEKMNQGALAELAQQMGMGAQQAPQLQGVIQ